MRVYTSNKYYVVGYTPGNQEFLSGWVLRESSTLPDYQPETVIVPECKFIHEGEVYFLTRSGEIQNNRRQTVQHAFEYVYR